MSKFIMYRYKREGSNQWFYAIRDTSLSIFTKNSYLIADQSSYPEDNLKMVWKTASYPSAVHDMIMRDENHEVVASAVNPQFLVCA